MSDASQSNTKPRICRLSGVQIVGTGSFVPDNVVTNEDLVSLGVDPEWIVQRTGIRERRHCPPDMATSHMSVLASQRCLQAAGVKPDQVDLLLLATFTPDYLLPATAPIVQDRLGLNCPATDLVAACAGFIYALVTGAQYVASGCSKYALVIGADANSRVFSPRDKRTYPLFGDGAGAVLLTAGSKEQGLTAYSRGSDGSGCPLLYREMGGTLKPFDPQNVEGEPWFAFMEGRSVFKWAVRLLEDSVKQVLCVAEKSVDDIDLWLLHQANTRILDAAADSLGIDPAKLVVHLDRYGNTSAGSVPIALDESLREGRIHSGDDLIMSGFGAGLSWGTACFKW